MTTYIPDAIIAPQFDRAWRGYEPKQVHEYVDALTSLITRLHQEISELEVDVARRDEELRAAQGRERHVLDALSTARGVAEAIEVDARSEAQQILDEARQQARRILDDAHRQRDEVFQQINDLELQRARLTRQIRQVLDAHLQVLETSFSGDLVEPPTPKNPLDAARQARLEARLAVRDDEVSVVRSPRHSTPTVKIRDEELARHRADSSRGPAASTSEAYYDEDGHDESVAVTPPAPPCRVDDANTPTVNLVGSDLIDDDDDARSGQTLHGLSPTPARGMPRLPTPPASTAMRSLEQLQADLSRLDDEIHETLLGMVTDEPAPL